MVFLKDILLSIWQALLALVEFFSQRTRAAGIEVDLLVIALMLAVLTLWLGSACWASSIASSRRHSPLVSFLLGLALPYGYPVFIMFAMDIAGAKQREQKQQATKAKEEEAQDERRRVAELVGRELLEEPAAAAEEQRRVFDAAYFGSIARDEQGNPTGPWRVVFGEQEVKVLQILEPLPDVVSVEIETRDGGRAKFRIPYARISVCEPG